MQRVPNIMSAHPANIPIGTPCEIALASAPVGRLLDHLGFWQGTGFLISNQLFITNNHVISNSQKAKDFLVEFNYELDAKGTPKPVSRFTLSPQDFFITSPEEDLDFTIVAMGKCVLGKATLSDLGFYQLKISSDENAIDTSKHYWSSAGQIQTNIFSTNQNCSSERDCISILCRNRRRLFRFSCFQRQMGSDSNSSLGNPHQNYLRFSRESRQKRFKRRYPN